MDTMHKKIPKKRTGLKIGIAFFFLIFLGASSFFAWLGFVILVPIEMNPAQEDGVVITIEENDSVADIAAHLEEKEVVRSAFGFRVYARFADVDQLFQKGEYTILPSSARTVATLLSQEIVSLPNEISVTLIEGWDSNEIQEHLLKQNLAVGDFGALVDESSVKNSDSFLFDGKPKNSSLEGYLFPDTYTVFENVTSQELIDMMIANLESRITEETKEKIAASDLSFYEILTLASIIEKEVAKPEDRRIVAGIFLNRLEDEYLLQSDATVNFITGKNTTRASFDDLSVQSPYNTYLFPGLPPGPIANPSIDAIEAVVNPIETDYYYFLTTLENETIFSTTLEEHTENTYKYYPE